MVRELLLSLLCLPEVSEVILTLNTPEDAAPGFGGRVRVIRNSSPRGFAANHNSAFGVSRGAFFCVMNPDIQLVNNPFPGLIAAINGCGQGVVAPLVVSPSGRVEDSARYFPTLWRLTRKVCTNFEGRFPLQESEGIVRPDWVAGMFMVFSRESFERLDGFDEGFHLYYEDVDICARCWNAGMSVCLVTDVKVQHDAQRASRRSVQHLRWHVMSMARYFWKHWFRLPR